MGEIAEDLCDGTACQWCGQYFQDPKRPDYVYTHGYPRSMQRLLERLQKALVDTV